MSSALHEIIVVDDDTSMSQAIERLLGTAGWRVRSFSSAELALASGALPAAAVVVIDLHLPGISGLALHRLLLEGGVGAPVLFITAQDRTMAREVARRAGAVGYLTKPFAGHELIDAIGRHLPAA